MADITQRILDKERQLGRLAGLSAYMRTPPPLWRTVIPGMFLFDFLARTAAQRRFADFYLIPRRAAMEAARLGMDGSDPEAMHAAAMAALRKGLARQRFDHENVRTSFMDVVLLLAGHYQSLIRTGKTTVRECILSAYAARSDLESFLKSLEQAEQRVDAAILTHAGEKRKDYLAHLAQGLYEQRVKQLDRWYWTDGEER